MLKRLLLLLYLGAAFITGAYLEASLKLTPSISTLGNTLYKYSIQYLGKVDVTGWVILAAVLVFLMVTRRADKYRGG